MRTIKLNNKEYPCRVTMGAMVRFKRMTGKEVTDLEGDITDLASLMYCCVQSACNVDGIDFTLDFETFADHVSMEDIVAFQDAGASTNSEHSKKNKEKEKASPGLKK